MLLVGKPEGKGSLGRPRRRWKDNIRIDITEGGWEGVDWMQWRALVNALIEVWLPYKVVIF
jgi:hypothetical protein